MRRIFAAFSVLLVAIAAALPASAGEMSRGLEALIQDQGLVGTDDVKVLVVMKNPDQVDIAQLDADLRAIEAPMSVRHRQVVELLQETATTTQADLLVELDRQRSLGTVVGYTPHWLINAVVVRTTVDGARALAARPDVDTIEPDLVTELIDPTENFEKSQLRGGGLGLLPGIEAIQADRVWNELGIDGTGALVANMDTGVDGSHPALSARWRGNTAPVSECWRDGADLGHSTPTDTNSHGTHVMGTITGFTPSDSIGVAPGAMWIADNSINQGAGSELDNDVIGALEWFADPDGDPGTTDDVPDVVQNSWGVNEGFAGYFDCDSRWWVALDNCEASGVVLTWSAGNEGPGSETHRSPADRAASPFNTFSVGSTQPTAPFEISSFSSRGPSGCGGPFEMKPEVSAPGSNIESSVPGGGYAFKSGTSMAGPHVAGVVGLMRAANPDIDVQTIKQVLMDTATDLGTPGEDNTYGHGFINAYEAVLAVIDGYGSIEGKVTDLATGNPIAGVTIDLVDDIRSVTSDGAGDYRFTLPEGSYTLEFSAFGYVTDTAAFSVTADIATNGDKTMASAPSAMLSGTVTDYNGDTISGATVAVLNTPLSPVLSQPDGTYSLSLPDLATYEVRASLTGLGPDTRTIVMSGDAVENFVLSELTWEGFETGDFAGLPWELGGTSPWVIDTSEVYEGDFSVRSGSISHNQESWMEVDLELSAAGDIEFAYKVSSESNYDYLRFYIDGAEQAEWAGAIEWTVDTFAVSAGPHVFRWAYEKDGSVDSGSDAAWVDSIIFPPTGQPDIDVSPPSITETLGPDESVDRDVTVTNMGSVPLNYEAALFGLQVGPWVMAAPTAGTISAGEQEAITVTFDSSTLFDGEYAAILRITSNDLGETPWDVPLSLTVSGVVGVNDALMPRALSLGAASPNPFGTQTALSFDVPVDGAVAELAVFDISGRHVQTLISGAQPGGRHVVIWDGRDTAGARVAPGVYFYRLRADGFEQTKRLIRLR